jgi:hypothetical protein
MQKKIRSSSTATAPRVGRIPDDKLDLVTMPEIKDFSKGVRGPYLQAVKELRDRRTRNQNAIKH